MPERGAARAAGPAGRGGARRASRPASQQLRVHDRRAFALDGTPSCSSRAAATPARTASRSRCRPTGAKRWRAPCSPSPRSSRSGSARATRCGWRRACACTATTSTRPPRRSRPGLDLGDPEGAPHRVARAQAAFPGAAVIEAQLGGRRGAQARRPGRPRARAGARAHRARRRARPPARRGHQRPLGPTSTSRSRWPMSPPSTRSSAHGSTPCARQAGADGSQRHAVRPAPLLPRPDRIDRHAATGRHQEPTA